MKGELDLKTLKLFKEALEKFYPRELGLVEDIPPFERWGKWEKKDSFWEDIRKYPELKDVTTPKEASQRIEELLEKANTEVKSPQSPEETTPQNLKDLTEREERERVQREEIREKQRKAVLSAQKRQRELYEEAQRLKEKIEEITKPEILDEYKGKKVYARVVIKEEDEPKIENLPAENQERLKHYQELVSQEKFETAKDELQKEIEARTKDRLKSEGLTEIEIRNLARESANEVIETLSQKDKPDFVPPTYQTAIIATIAQDNNVIPKIIGKNTAQELIKTSANNVAVFRIQPEILTRNILDLAFDEEFSDFILGADTSKLKVALSPTIPLEAKINKYKYKYKEVDLEAIHDRQIKIYEGRSAFLEAIADKREGKERIAGDYIQSNVANFILKKIEKLPADSVIRKVVASSEAKAIFFAKFGIGEPIVWQYANPTLMRVMGQSQLAGAFFSGLGKLTGKEIVKPVAGKAVGQAVGKVATQAAVKTGLSATLATIFSAASFVGTILGWIAGELLAKGLSKLKVWWTKNKEKIAPVLGVGIGLSLAGFGFGPAILGGTLTYFLFGGTAAGILFGPIRFFTILARNMVITIATPVIVALLALPPLVAFIMLVINNSAYVVPPSPLQETSVNPYIEVDKKVDPSGPFENSDLPLTVKYIVTISAKRDILTDIEISDICKIVQEASTLPCKNVSFDIPEKIAPGNPYVLTYQNTYNEFTTDALVVNLFEVTAAAGENGKQTSSTTASITIGDPPSTCIVFEGDWPADKIALIENALYSEIQPKYPGFLAKICQEYPNGVPFLYNRAGSGDLWGYWSKGKVTFYPKGLENKNDAIYTVSHELLHVLLSSNFYSLNRQYEQIANIFNEIPRCFYTYDPSLKEERLAEAVAFTIMPQRSCRLTGKSSSIDNWPKHKDFVLQSILK